ncbi:MAG TPA: hypothetical protein VJ828_02745 [Lacipirellulaceae bacterium]|nr:hypothetical protein [Lacipirellulaceae bacterium]
MTVVFTTKVTKDTKSDSYEITGCEGVFRIGDIASSYLLRVLCDLRGYKPMLTIDEALEMVARQFRINLPAAR